MQKLRAGLIGLGVMGRHHARVLSSLDGVDLVAAVDPAGNQKAVPEGTKLLDSVEQIVAEKIDYCVVAAPTIFHEEIGIALASSGVHALLEKPIASTMSEASNLVEAFESRSLIGAVGHIERYNPALQEARKRIQNGEIGRVFQVSTRRQNGFPARISDVGVVKDLATHDIDLTTWVTGQKYKWIKARTACRSGREHEDLVSAVGQLEDDTVTNHLVNWLSPFKERVTVITGERGAFVCDTLSADLTFHKNGTEFKTWDGLGIFHGVSEGDVTKFAIAKPEPLRTEHENFRDAILGKDSDIVTMRQGLETLKVAIKMLESSREN